MRRRRVQAFRTDQPPHPRIERVARQLLLFDRERGEAPIGAQGVVGQGRQSSIGAAHERSKHLEPGAGPDDIVRVQEGPLPETLTSDGAIRLSVDGQKDATGVGRLVDPLHQHQHVTVWIGEDRPGPQSIPGQLDRIVVRVVVREGRARAARVHLVRQQPQELLHAAERFLGHAFEHGFVGDEISASRRPRVGAAIAIAQTEREAHLPAEIRAQEIGQVRAIRRRVQGGFSLEIVLPQT